MQIFFIIPFIFYINIFFGSSYAPTGCTLPPIKYKPAYIQAHNTELKKWRQSLNSISTETEYENLLKSNRNIKCLEKMPENISDHLRCFQYAIEKITGFNGFIELPEKNCLSINLEKYFQQTAYPKKNGLMIYTTDEKNHEIHHFAVAIDQIWFESKSGSLCQASRHLPFDLLGCYGGAVWSFELKQEYIAEEGQNRLIRNMQLDMYHQMSIISKHIILQNQKIGDLQDQNKKNKVKYFWLGCMAGIAYMICVDLLVQQDKKSLS